MRVVHTLSDLEKLRTSLSGRVGFVPTMGYLHAGHLALVQRARAENEQCLVSIFVNPTQFGPSEDLNRYPRDLARDLALLEAEHAAAVFVPTAEEMYPSGFTTFVQPVGPLAEQGEGAARLGHFRGVATVVLKLFQLVRPHVAYFGQKDAQQVAVITQMVRDFNLPIPISIHPTLREADGLAKSSRNSYLNSAQRDAASVLYRALQAGRQAFSAGSAAQIVIETMRAVILAEPLAHLEYAELRDPASFLPLLTLQAPALLLLAVRLGPARLIDNFALHADGTWDTGILDV